MGRTPLPWGRRRIFAPPNDNDSRKGNAASLVGGVDDAFFCHLLYAERLISSGNQIQYQIAFDKKTVATPMPFAVEQACHDSVNGTGLTSSL